jgi:Fe-S-cluster containining protein
VSDDDCEALAGHFNLSVPDFIRRYTRVVAGERCLRRKPDTLLGGQTCILLDKHTRLCGAHQARPEVCRVWPPRHTRGRCPYYDVLQFEQRHQGNKVLLRVELTPVVEE